MSRKRQRGGMMPMVMPHPVQYGGDFLGIGNWIKGAANTVYDKVLVPTNDWLKKTKVASTVLGMIPHPAAKAAGMAARLGGYGKGRRRGRAATTAAGQSF